MGCRCRTRLWSLATDNPGYAVSVARMLVGIPDTNTHPAIYFYSLHETECFCIGGISIMPRKCVVVRQLFEKFVNEIRGFCSSFSNSYF
jgi:hypothetical protein